MSYHKCVRVKHLGTITFSSLADMIQQRFNHFKYLLQWIKDPMTKPILKRTRKSFQSLVMQVPKPRIVSFVELEDKSSKLKDNNLKSTMSPRVYTQDASMG